MSTPEPTPNSRAITTEELPAAERSRTVAFREAIAGDPETSGGLGTFRGVFRPTVMTILGVMMYLRLGWVVGEAGLLGALAIIALIFGITIPTALSLSSITTNIRLGAGGVFTLISQSLGLETGGAIGIPLYLAQALSAGLYLYGFTEAWGFIFPEHPSWAVLMGVFAVVFVTTSVSIRLAFGLQGIVLFVVLASLTSVTLGAPMFETSPLAVMETPQWWGTFEGGDFWYIFAVFFPAGTGIMVGAGMSGTLANPRRSIPRGTMFAVLTALVVYSLFAIWYGIVATPEELRGNYLIVVERAAWGPLVLAGLLASTFTAALSSMVAAPQVLHALARHRILPRSEVLTPTSKGGEPRRASLATGAIVAASLTLGSLDRVAVLITMFFLLTYLIVNVVVLIEQSLGMVSWRPRFKIPILVPIVGAFGASLAIFIVSPAFALVALAMVVGIYAWLLNRELETPWETVRSSIFVSLVDWASRRVTRDDGGSDERSWKPDLLVPVTSRAQLDGNFRFLRALTHPKGSLQVVGVVPTDKPDRVRISGLREIIREFQEDDLYATATVLESENLVRGVRQCCAALGGSRFRPNVLYALAEQHDEETLQGLLDASIEFEMGAAFVERHPEAAFGHERVINVWVRDQSPDWHLGLRLANLDLAILAAYQVSRNWDGRIRLITAMDDEENEGMAHAYLQQLIEDARLDSETETVVINGSFVEALKKAPHCDLSIVGLAPEIDRDFFANVAELTGSSVLFVMDSGHESALA